MIDQRDIDAHVEWMRREKARQDNKNKAHDYLCFAGNHGVDINKKSRKILEAMISKKPECGLNE